MKKIKETKFSILKKNYIKNDILLDYQHFLKNNYLKKNKYKLNNNLFENTILLKKNELNLIELNQNNNIWIPILNNKLSIIYTIQRQYQNYLLFDYKFNYNLLYNYNKILLKKTFKEKNKKIKGRILSGNKKRILIAIFGLIFSIRPKQLHKNKRVFYGSKLKSTKIILFYKLKYLYFKIDVHPNKKSILSRKIYVKEINKKK